MVTGGGTTATNTGSNLANTPDVDFGTHSESLGPTDAPRINGTSGILVLVQTVWIYYAMQNAQSWTTHPNKRTIASLFSAKTVTTFRNYQPCHHVKLFPRPMNLRQSPLQSSPTRNQMYTSNTAIQRLSVKNCYYQGLFLGNS